MKKPLIIALALSLTNLLFGEVFYVSTTGSDSNDGKSWETAFADVQTAIDAAHNLANENNDGNSVEIWVAKGVYRHGTALRLESNVSLCGGFAGNEASKDDRQPEANETILDGDGSYSVFDNSFSSDYEMSNSSIEWLIIQNGKAEFSYGGAMTCRYASLNISNCKIINNYGSGSGGIIAYNSYLNIKDSEFINNKVANGPGGAFWISSSSRASFSNCTISSNSVTTEGAAGGILTSECRFDNCTFYNNETSSSDRSTIYISSRGSAYFTNCTFYRNQGIFCFIQDDEEYGDIGDFKNCIIWNNGELKDYKNVSITHSVVNDKNISGEGNIYDDPLLGEIDYYGGYVQTIPVKEGSPAVGKADSTVAPSYATDARGIYRSKTPTIGSFEYINDGTKHYCIFKSNKSIVLKNTEVTFVIESDAPIGSYQIEKDEFSYISGDSDSSIVTLSVPIETAGEHVYALRVSNYLSFIKPIKVKTWTGKNIVYVSEFGSDSNSGETFGNAIASIQNAINIAHQLSSNENPAEVWITSGKYYVKNLMMKNNVQIYGSFAGIESTKEERNSGISTILSGNNESPVISNIFMEQDPLTGSALIDSVEISDGYNSDKVSNNTAGGINLTNASPCFSNCNITRNNGSAGAAICAMYSNSVFKNCSITYNTGDSIGALRIAQQSDLDFYNCQISGNNATQTSVAHVTNSKVKFTNCIIDENTTPNRSLEISAYSELEFLNCTILNNNGTLYDTKDFSDYDKITFRNSIVWNNGVLNQASNVTAYNCILNSALYGANNIYEDPKIGNKFTYNNLKILPVLKDSSAVGAADDTISPATDIAGNERKVFVTIGAYEIGCSNSNYLQWVANSSMSGKNKNLEATPFNDGITNIEKFAFGLSGNKAASYAENALFKQSYADGKACFQFPISKDAADSVNVKVMTSEDLVNWVEAQSSNIGESSDFNLMQTEQTVPEGGKLFFKLIVEEK